MRETSRRWLTYATAATISTAIGVTVNIATDLMSSAWAWTLVGVLTIAGIVVGVGIDKGRRPSADAHMPISTPPAGASLGSAHVNKSTAIVINGDRNRLKIVSNPASTVVAVGLTAIVAVVAGMFVGSSNNTTVNDSNLPVPFALTVVSDPQDAAFGTSSGNPEDYVFPLGSVSELPPPEPEGECWAWQRWAEQHGGVRAKSTQVAFIVSALDHPVRLHGARLVVDRQPGPTTGDKVTCVQGGPTPISRLSIDLDNETAIYSYPDETPNGDQGRPLALDIDPGKSERVAVYATSRECYCRWHLELQLESQGKAYTQSVDNHGEPFVIAPAFGQYINYVYYPTEGRWKEGIG